MLIKKRGYTLIESLVAITIIGVLIALLLPAVQSARESARRTQCMSHLRQMGIGMHHYHDALGTFPPGICSSSHTFWSGFLLPYVEQQPLFDTIDFSQPWDVGANALACTVYLPIYRCPSSTAPRHITAQGIANRGPSDYLACTSGTATRESGDSTPLAGRADSDGIFYVDSATRVAEIIDGTSMTIALGEAMFIYRPMGLDHTGFPQFLDRWYLGTLEGLDNEVSEGMGSTGVAINSHKLDVFVDEKELSFGSHHPGGVQVIMADGSVKFIAESIDRATWRALGTRNGRDLVDAR